MSKSNRFQLKIDQRTLRQETRGVVANRSDVSIDEGEAIGLFALQRTTMVQRRLEKMLFRFVLFANQSEKNSGFSIFILIRTRLNQHIVNDFYDQ